jgi:hypothetical protein
VVIILVLPCRFFQVVLFTLELDKLPIKQKKLPQVKKYMVGKALNDAPGQNK